MDWLAEVLEGRAAGTGMPPQLVKYWVAGAGAAKIRWGISGDFDRCVRNIQAEASEKGRPLSPHVIHGLCATLHKLATGATPGHAPGEGGGGHHHGRSAGMARDPKKPYGDVPYADPGYQADGKKRYPLTRDKVMAAWSYINQPENAKKYTAEQLKLIKGRIRAAMEKFGHAVADSGRSEQSMDVERRFTTVTVEARSIEGRPPRIGGYAAKFNTYSRNLGGFVETVDMGFFNKSRGEGWPDVVARFNHEDSQLLGTTAGRTLSLAVDNVGLNYEVEPPPSMRHVVELVQRGDVQRSSFAFRTLEDDWTTTDDGGPLRSLVTGVLVDVAPVVTPAYIDTSAGLRSLAVRFDADIEEVRSLADAGELRKFFHRTDDGGPAPKPRMFGAAAATALLARRNDPYL